MRGRRSRKRRTGGREVWVNEGVVYRDGRENEMDSCPSRVNISTCM